MNIKNCSPKLGPQIIIIIDDNLYHVGASLKDLGKKCFGINKIEDKDYLKKIMEVVC